MAVNKGLSAARLCLKTLKNPKSNDSFGSVCVWRWTCKLRSEAESNDGWKRKKAHHDVFNAKVTGKKESSNSNNNNTKKKKEHSQDRLRESAGDQLVLCDATLRLIMFKNKKTKRRLFTFIFPISIHDLTFFSPHKSSKFMKQTENISQLTEIFSASLFFSVHFFFSTQHSWSGAVWRCGQERPLVRDSDEQSAAVMFFQSIFFNRF